MVRSLKSSISSVDAEAGLVAWRGVAWCGVVWCGVVWRGVGGVAWRGAWRVAWCGVPRVWLISSIHMTTSMTYYICVIPIH